MAITISPSTEACEALIDRINSGTDYALPVAATFAEQFSDDQQDMQLQRLIVDVVPFDEEQLNETLASEDRTQHSIGIEIRCKLEDDEQFRVDDLKKVVKQIWRRVNLFRNTAARVTVWDAAVVANENPNKKLLTEALIFRSRLMLRVEVEAYP